MKPRRVILTVEIETDMKIADLKRVFVTEALKRAPDEPMLVVLQVQANVVRPARGKKQ